MKQNHINTCIHMFTYKVLRETTCVKLYINVKWYQDTMEQWDQLTNGDQAPKPPGSRPRQDTASPPLGVGHSKIVFACAVL